MQEMLLGMCTLTDILAVSLALKNERLNPLWKHEVLGLLLNCLIFATSFHYNFVKSYFLKCLVFLYSNEKMNTFLLKV